MRATSRTLRGASSRRSPTTFWPRSPASARTRPSTPRRSCRSCHPTGSTLPPPPTCPSSINGPPSLPDTPFAYCILRVVPDVERAEFLNAGVVLFARQAGFLAAQIALDRARLHTLSPGAAARGAPGGGGGGGGEPIARHLEVLERVAAGDPEAGPIAAMEPSER